MNTTHDPGIEQFKASVRQEWTGDKTVTGWRVWHPKFVRQSHAATEAILRAAEIQPGEQVLDLASGTGDPALSLAIAVGPSGHVTVTDFSSGMLATARANADEQGLTNLTFTEADAHLLPFPDQSFDVVTSRLGVMYFADCGQAIREIHRVLKPGGRIALVAWGPLNENPFMAHALTPFLQRVTMPPRPPGAPHPFKFAQHGTLCSELVAAGFRQVCEDFETIPYSWPGPPEELWQFFQDVAVPFQPIIEGLLPDERTVAIGEVLTGFRQFYDGQQVKMRVSIVVASGVRA